MFDMGFLELLVISVIALIVLGPERLPKAARTVGLWIGKAKQGFESIKTEIDRELKVKELQQQLEEQKKQLEANLDVSTEVNTLKKEIEQTGNNIHQELTPSNSGSITDKSASDEQVSDTQITKPSASQVESIQKQTEQTIQPENTEQMESEKTS